VYLPPTHCSNHGISPLSLSLPSILLLPHTHTRPPQQIKALLLASIALLCLACPHTPSLSSLSLKPKRKEESGIAQSLLPSSFLSRRFSLPPSLPPSAHINSRYTYISVGEDGCANLACCLCSCKLN
jgi:hypothetical protein